MRTKKFNLEILQALLITFSFVFVIVIIYYQGLLSSGSKRTHPSPDSIDQTALRRSYSKQRFENDEDATAITSKTPSSDRIIMHEASGRPFLLWRQTCSLESVARSNPDRPIYLYMSTETTTPQTPWMDIVRQFKNIEVVLLNNAHYFNGTQFDAWYKEGEWQNSPFEISHMSSYIRWLTLLRGGGLFIDMDVILFRRLEKEVFKNVFVYSSESKTYIDTSVFHLEADHRLIRKIIDALAHDYDSEEDIYNASAAVEQSLKDLCGMLGGNPSSNRCADVTLLPHSYIYPMAQRKWKLLFKEADPQILANITKSYGIHTYLSTTNVKMTDLGSSQLLAQLARKYCPSTASKAVLYHHGKL